MCLLTGNLLVPCAPWLRLHEAKRGVFFNSALALPRADLKENTLRSMLIADESARILPAIRGKHR